MSASIGNPGHTLSPGAGEGPPPKTKATPGQIGVAFESESSDDKATPSHSVAQQAQQSLDAYLEVWEPLTPKAGAQHGWCSCCGLDAIVACCGFYSPDQNTVMFYDDTYFYACHGCTDEMYRRTPAGLRYRAELTVYGQRATQAMRDERERKFLESVRQEQHTSGRAT
jgi:hypothetical protein